jgi:hypothetical protein
MVVHHHQEAPTLGMPAAIRQALIDRVRLPRLFTSLRREALETLADLLPSELAAHPWATVWPDWDPEERAALADALGRADYPTPAARDGAGALLQQLMGDGQYGVRRAAYRALARHQPEQLAAVSTFAR